MANEHILVVDDEPDILDLIRYNLEKEGYEVTGALSGEQALNCVKQAVPDLIVLDLMLPGVNGLDVCKRLRADRPTVDVPIIMVTAKAEESDIVIGLELGADDYVVKPFSPKVLVARVRSVLRRRSRGPSDDQVVLHVHDILIDPGRHRVSVKGEPVDLTATEFRILHLLARRQGWVFTRDRIVDEIHGDDYPVTDRAVDVQIVGLRRKLAAAGKCIETVRGVGYRLKE